MAASSNRSPSPSSATGRSNPNPRNSEISNTVRRSFSGNPFTKPSIVANMKGVNPVTPANSPAGFPRRHSTGKEGGLPHHNEKENEKDQTPKPVRIRSPSVPKGTAKNFMSPTISAASKITASPRKKVLGERNELIRTSVSSSSDGKGILGSLNIQEVVEDLNLKPASSDSTVVDPDQREACSSPSGAKEVPDFQVPKSKNDTEFLSASISGIDVCSKSKPSPSPSWTSRSLAAVDADPSLPPYDPKTNYLSPRPRFLHYKPNPRIEKIRLRECNRLEDCFTSEVPSDTETSEETQSEKSSCVVLMEGQDEEEEDSEAAVEETAQDKPNVSEISTTEEEEDSEAALEETDQVKPNVSEKSFPVVLLEGQDEEEEDSEADLEETAQVQPRAQNSKSHSVGLKPISMLLLLLLVGCLWRPISDSPLISSVIDSSIGKQSGFTKFSEPAELAEFVRTNVDGLTRNFWLWSTNTVSYISKMIPSLKEPNELSFLRLGNFTDFVKEQILQCPIKEMIGIVPIKEQGNLVSKAYEKAEGASQLHPECEDAKMVEETEIIEPDQLALEQIQEYHAASPSSDDPGQASQGEPEFKESSLSLQDEVVEPHNSEAQQAEEESIQAEVEQASHGKPESEESSLSPQDDEVVEPHQNLRVQQTEEESKLISHEAEVVEPHSSILAEAKVISSHTDHEARSIISEKEQEAQVPQVSEIESEMPQVDNLHGEVEPSVAAVPEPESSQTFKELCLSLKEKSSNFNILGISSILILTVAAASIFAKQQKSPTPSVTAMPMDQLLVKKLASMPTASVENTYERRLSSRNWPTEVDMIGESCPSEMSSFQKTTSSYSKKESKGVTEAQSPEKGMRKSNKRESLASSSEYSTGSPSYGSFTSYEKIHSKHGCGDQEVVTPVRRSSRIRKQVITSS